MGWSLSHIRRETPDAVRAALCAAGRALYLATAFESKCIYVLRLGLLAQAIVADPEQSFDAILDSVPYEQRLHRVLEMLVKLPIVRDEEASILWRAKEARNFIVHECAAFGPIFDVSDQVVRNRMRVLRGEVAYLAAGDNIVSTMHYEIDEKEPAPREIVEFYPQLVDDWVFNSERQE